MSTDSNQTDNGMPPVQRGSYVAGTNSPFTSAAKAGSISAQNHARLIGQKGGIRNKHKGGANAGSVNNDRLTVPVVTDPTNSTQNAGQIKNITALAAGASANSVYDSKVKVGGSNKRRSSRRRRSRSSRRRSRSNSRRRSSRRRSRSSRRRSRSSRRRRSRSSSRKNQ
jgi:hypothetical protein